MRVNSRFDGRIEVICGSMFSGKTEELINRIKKAEIAGIDYIVFKPQIDSRNPENKIISHQKKLKPIPFVITNALGYGATILAGFGLIAVLLGHV